MSDVPLWTAGAVVLGVLLGEVIYHVGAYRRAQRRRERIETDETFGVDA